MGSLSRQQERKLRRKIEKQNSKNALDIKNDNKYKLGHREGMFEAIDITFYMTAYTLNYKLGFGKKRLAEIMSAIYNNIDAFRTGHLQPNDYKVIKDEVHKLGITMKEDE